MNLKHRECHISIVFLISVQMNKINLTLQVQIDDE